VPETEFLILFCGHDFKRKGLDRAIAALARMSQPAHLVVVGGVAGGRLPEYEQLVATLGVVDRVHFAGARHDTHRFFQAADVFVLPTRVDTWGITVVEAMATGIPAIVTDVAGSASFVEDGVSGYVLASPFDAGQLSALLDRLASDADLRVRVGESAGERARRLEWKHHVDVVEAELLAVATRAGRRERRDASGSTS
jgi:glycosyltransferase involved in cell wall biosynthesis